MSIVYVENTRARFSNLADAVLLKPGVNEVESSKWDRVKDHPVVKWRIENGVLLVKDGSKPISDMPAGEAVKLVKATVDADLLERWRRDDPRRSVRDAIDSQLDKLTAPETE